MDQVFINNLLVRGIIGVNDWERVTEQEININIVLFVDIRRAGNSDDINDCVNYQTVAERVQAHVQIAKRFTVEALAADIARLCLEDDRVEKVRVRIEKPGAVRFSSSVGVEIERSRAAAEHE